ncbi:transcriptional repressor [Candidatus Cloacimonadaceae bacterium]|jgi:Fur family ferric uptake transcriptional regulator
MADHATIFRDYLAKKGLKLTSPRKKILEAVFAIHEHFNAEELYGRIKSHSQGISLATVYRTLPLLLEAGLVQHALRSAGRERYEHIYGHPKHIHWLCRSCGSLVETDLQSVDPLIAELAKSLNFKEEDIELSIRGLCWKCASTENENQTDER